MTDWPKRDQVDPNDLLGASEVLELVGWNHRASISDAEERLDFPPPIRTIRGARLWHQEDIRRWITLHPRHP